MPRVSAAIVACVLVAACGEKHESPLDVRFPGYADNAPALKLPNSAPSSSYQYAFEVKSNIRETVELKVRLEGETPEGMAVKLSGRTSLLRQSTSKGKLVVVMPSVVGPFEGRITLYSPGLPDWKLSWPVTGDVVDKPLEGRYLRPRPISRDFGEMQPGETRPFAIALGNGGTEQIKIKTWSVSHEDRVKVRFASRDLIILPGAELQVSGHATAPKEQGPFTYQIRLVTDAQNYPRGVALRLVGEVVPDYAVTPVRYRDTVVPTQGREIVATIRAREGSADFFVERIDGHEAYFTVLDDGGKEPAREKKVRFKLRTDAPTDVEQFQQIRIRFRLGPGRAEADWRIALRLLPKIYPNPRKINFGRVGHRTRVLAKAIDLKTFTAARFRVTNVRAVRGKVVPEARQAQGMTPRIVVTPAPGLGPGQHTDTIVIETDDPDVPALQVKVWIEVEP